MLGEIDSERYAVSFSCERVTPGYLFRSTTGNYFRNLSPVRASPITWPLVDTTGGLLLRGCRKFREIPPAEHRFVLRIFGYEGYELTPKEEPVVSECLSVETKDLTKCLNDKNVRGLVAETTRVTRVLVDGKNIISETSKKDCLDFVGRRFVDDDSSCSKWGNWGPVQTKILPSCR